MKSRLQRKYRILVAETYNGTLLRVVEIGKDIGTAIGHHAVWKRAGQRCCCFKLPVTIYQVAERRVGQQLPVTYPCCALADGRLLGLIQLPDGWA